MNNLIKHVRTVPHVCTFHPSPPLFMPLRWSTKPPPLPRLLSAVRLTGPWPACCRAAVQVSSFVARRPWGCTSSTTLPEPQTCVSFPFSHLFLASVFCSLGTLLFQKVQTDNSYYQSSIRKCGWGSKKLFFLMFFYVTVTQMCIREERRKSF